jgi:hypothetical protein
MWKMSLSELWIIYSEFPRDYVVDNIGLYIWLTALQALVASCSKNYRSGIYVHVEKLTGYRFDMVISSNLQNFYFMETIALQVAATLESTRELQLCKKYMIKWRRIIPCPLCSQNARLLSECRYSLQSRLLRLLRLLSKTVKRMQI